VARPRRFLRRTVRAVSILVQDGRIPKPLRWCAALGLLPIPGPFDEAVLLLTAVPLVIFYRAPMREAWNRSACAAHTPPGGPPPPLT
jgi:hypothetical protein